MHSSCLCCCDIILTVFPRCNKIAYVLTLKVLQAPMQMLPAAAGVQGTTVGREAVPDREDLKQTSPAQCWTPNN
jgi:hypothetical protein